MGDFMNELAKLMICLKSYGFTTNDIKIVYETGTLSNLDLLTHPFQDVTDFFLKNQESIINRIKRQIPLYEVNVNFDFLELNSEIDNPIYIEKDQTILPALLKTMKTEEGEVSLEYFIKKHLMNNGLYLLHLCDSFLQPDIEYESIFKNCDKRIYAKIKANLVNEQDIDYVWNFLKTKNRFYSVIRFLLNSENLENIVDCFSKMIPLKETRETRDYERIITRKQTWLPYKDSE